MINTSNELASKDAQVDEINKDLNSKHAQIL